MRFMVAALLWPALLCSAVGAQSSAHYANPPAVLYLHSWLPQLGPLPNLPSPQEVALLRVAECARDGDFLEAERILHELRANNSDPQTGYLTLIYERDMNMRKTLVMGDELLAGGEWETQTSLALVEYEHLSDQIQQIADRAGRRHFDQVFTINWYANFVTDCIVGTPQLLREHRISREITESQQSLSEDLASREKCTQFIKQAALDPMLNVLDPRSMSLLRLWTEARLAVAMGENEEAASKLEEGAAITVSEHLSTAINYWMLSRGDLDLTPHGTPFTLGYDLASEPAMRKAVVAGLQLGVLASASRESRLNAFNWYDKGVDLPKSELQMRSAYLRFLEGDSDASDGFYLAARLAENEGRPRVRAYALAAQFLTEFDPSECEYGLFSERRGCFAQAVDTAVAQRDPGTVLGLAEMAISAAARAGNSEHPVRAVRILEIAARAMRRLGHERMAAEILSDAATLNAELGEEDQSIYERITEIDSWGRWIDSRQIEIAHPNQAGRQPSGHTLDTEFTKYAGELGKLLSALHFKVLVDGEDGWIVPLAKYAAIAEKMLKGNSNPKLSSIWDEYVEEAQSDLHVSKGNEMFMRGNCDDIVSAFETRKINPTVDFAEWLDLASPAAYCDARIRKEVGDVLLHLTPVNAIRSAAQEYERSPTFRSKKALDAALFSLSPFLATARMLDRGDVIEAYISQLSQASKDFPGVLDFRDEDIDLQVAHFQILQGHAAQGRDLLLRLQSHWSPADEIRWSETDYVFQAQVASDLVEADLLLGKEEDALLATEWMRLAIERRGKLRMGAHHSMLVRKAIVDPNTLSRNEETDILKLEEQTMMRRWADPEPPDLASLRRELSNLPTNTVLLVLYPVRFSILAWRIERGSPITFRRLSWRPVEDLAAIRSLSDAVVNRMMNWEVPAKGLYDLLLKPLGPLPPDSTVALLCGFSLRKIPFELLGPDREHPLILKHPVVYLNQLVQPGPVHLIKGNLVLSTTPEEMRQTLGISVSASGCISRVGDEASCPPRHNVVIAGPNLESASREADVVAELLGTSALAGPQSSIDKVEEALRGSARRMQGPRYVHIAAHGVIDQTNPFRSYLELSDGRLEGWQLFESAATSELLVLSGCDTKRGREQALRSLDPAPGPELDFWFAHSERITSITSLASLGGARRIVSSIRPTDDDDTLELMRLFYKRLATDPAVALQAAKRELISGSGGDANRYADFVLTVRDISSLLMRRDTP